MPFASALSLHPDAAEATGEVAGRVLEQLGPGPDLAVLFVSPHHVDAVADIAAAVRALVEPGLLLGATGVAVVGGDREIEDEPAISLWVGRLAAPPRPVRVTAARTPSGAAIGGLTATTCGPGEVLVLLADPFSLPMDDVVELLGELDPPVPVVGGAASAARGPGGNRLVLDSEVVVDGGVGAILPASVATTLVVSQGCRPVGEPMIVTRATRNLLVELAGRPALDRLEDVVRAAGPDERAKLAAGLHVGIAVDEHKMTFDRGDFLVRNLI
ncbi:MAG TPA: FIST N-terminal domain-containing protein, partial [Acidimicrobiales bacterium]